MRRPVDGRFGEMWDETGGGMGGRDRDAIEFVKEFARSVHKGRTVLMPNFWPA